MYQSLCTRSVITIQNSSFCNEESQKPPAKMDFYGITMSLTRANISHGMSSHSQLMTSSNSAKHKDTLLIATTTSRVDAQPRQKYATDVQSWSASICRGVGGFNPPTGWRWPPHWWLKIFVWGGQLRPPQSRSSKTNVTIRVMSFVFCSLITRPNVQW